MCAPVESPIIFKQIRPGLNAETFRMVKFRTMLDDKGPDGAMLSDEGVSLWMRRVARSDRGTAPVYKQSRSATQLT